jgi:hypothetical protein
MAFIYEYDINNFTGSRGIKREMTADEEKELREMEAASDKSVESVESRSSDEGPDVEKLPNWMNPDAGSSRMSVKSAWDYYWCRLPKHLRRKWGRAIRRQQTLKNDRHQPTRRGYMIFSHTLNNRDFSIWRGSFVAKSRRSRPLNTKPMTANQDAHGGK